MRTILIILAVAAMINSCKKNPDTCTAGQARDMRAGMMASASYGLCIPDTAAFYDFGETEIRCKGAVVSKLQDAKNGIETEKCLSGCTAGNFDEASMECRTQLRIGEKCNIIADCITAFGKTVICFKDPQVSGPMVTQYSQTAMTNTAFKAWLSSIGHKKVTADLLTGDPELSPTDIGWGMGLNFCTIMDCDKADNDCPDGSECVDMGRAMQKALGAYSETGQMLCMKTAELPDEASLPDDDASQTNDSDIAAVSPKCLDDQCTTHENCKKEGCEATFCLNEIVNAVVKAGQPAPDPVCAVRCDPANNNSDCPPGNTCNDQIKMLTFIDPNVNLDGALGLCESAN